MSVTLKMLSLDEFIPINGNSVVIFSHSSFYSNVEMATYQVEFTYQMIDGDGCPVPSWVCYDGDDDLPFDAPFIFKDGKKVMLSLEDCKEIHNRHPCHHYRHWWIKDWYLVSGSRQMNRDEILHHSVGIMDDKDFIKELNINCEHLVQVNRARREQDKNLTDRCVVHDVTQTHGDRCDLCRIEDVFTNLKSAKESRVPTGIHDQRWEERYKYLKSQMDLSLENISRMSKEAALDRVQRSSVLSIAKVLGWKAGYEDLTSMVAYIVQETIKNHSKPNGE